MNPPVPPFLPASLLPTILPLLLPPQTPLPPSLLSKPLLQRHHFLPPTSSNPDAYLTPYPTPTKTSATSPTAHHDRNPLTTLLEHVSTTDWVHSKIQYAHDGEYWLARCNMHAQPTTFASNGTTKNENEEGELKDSGVEVIFLFEETGGEQGGQGGQGQGQGRGWVYHACSIPNIINPQLDFYPSPELVPNSPLPKSSTSNSTSINSSNSNSLDTPDITSTSFANNHKDTTTTTTTPTPTTTDTTYTSQEPNPLNADDESRLLADYWAGFTPPSSTSGLPNTTQTEQDGDGEEDYWRMYNQGEPGGSQTPGPIPGTRDVSRGNSVLDFSGLGLNNATSQGRGNDVSEKRNHDYDHDKDRDNDDDDDTKGRGGNVVDLTLVGEEDDLAKGLTRVRGEGDDSILREKVKGRIKVMLRNTWVEFSADDMGGGHIQEVLEERAHAWLALGRGIVFDTLKRNVQAGYVEESARTVRTKARLEVLHEMWEVLGETGGDGVDGEDGFWRLIEGSIISQGQGVRPEVERRESDLYWES